MDKGSSLKIIAISLWTRTVDMYILKDAIQMRVPSLLTSGSRKSFHIYNLCSVSSVSHNLIIFSTVVSSKAGRKWTCGRTAQ